LAVRFLGAAALTALIATSLPRLAVGPPAGGPVADAKVLDLANLDPTCKACDDFYQFATGGWLKKNPIPAGHAASLPKRFTDAAADASLNDVLGKAYVEKAFPPAAKTRALALVNTTSRACSTTTSSRSIG
jgi:predicted metalloendopeptidase